MTTWTTEQQQAIDIRGRSLLVAAAAGSGKTAVLVERIIQMISDESNPVDIDQLLVVTFTNAAAAEMKERIGAAIQKKLLEQPLSEHLYRQSLLLHKAQITTLHSFCLELVRQNFFRLGLDPQLKIADETENQLILSEALDEVLEQYYSHPEKQEAFIALVDAYGGREDLQLRSILLRLYHMAQSMAQPQVWLQQLVQSWDTDWFAQARQDVEQQLRTVQKLLMRASNLAAADAGLSGYLDNLEREYNWSCELLLAARQNWEALEQQFAQNRFERLPAAKKGTFDEEVKEQVTGYRDQAKKQMEKLRKDYFSRSRAEQLQELEAQQPTRQLLVELSLALLDLFQQKKAEKNLMDFSDMEHFCFRLLYEETEQGQLQLTELAQTLQQQYQEVMVDEYQDINDLQENILQAVSRENNLFMVGDIKQSIYGFRMANPQLFAEKYQQFPADGDGCCQRLDLNRNFRCRRSVVDGVNEVFSQLMKGENGDLRYDEQAALVYGADYPSTLAQQAEIPEQIQLLVLTAPEEQEESGNQEQPLSAMEEEGLLLCQQMQQLMAEQALVYDKRLQQYRAVTWRDMVVLLRAPKAAGSVYARIMKEAGIPAAVDTGDGYFSAWEIQIMLALLHIVDNPLQDIPLLAVLRAPFFVFTEDELSQLRLLAPKDYFYSCLEQAAQPHGGTDQQLQQKAAAFLQQLQSWRKLARQLDLSSFIWQLYKDTGFYEYVGALRDGVQRQANLRALQERARGYEKTSFHGVFMFLRFLEQMQENQADLEPARILSDNEDVVRIMSIHKSKGLEFPVVFIGGMGRRFNLRDGQQDFLLDKKYGLAFPMVDGELEIKYQTIAQRVIGQRKRIEALQEEKRILYVAMTRARERLYLVGSCADPAKKQEMAVDKAQCYLDWLLPLSLQAPLWRVQLIAAGSTALSAAEETMAVPLAQLIGQGQPLPFDGRWQQQLDAQLGWQYPQPRFINVKAQFSVTELKQKLNPQSQADGLQFSFDSRPQAVVEKEGLTSAERGTLLHLLLSRVDLSAQIDEGYLQQLVAQLEAKKFIAAGEADGISLRGILEFFQCPLGKRLLAADPSKRYREMPFMVTLDSHVLDDALPEGEKNILVQGIIDCLWQEADGQWVLVDYKSDRISSGQNQLILERYGGQMRLYRYAVERILGQPVKEAYFYMVSNGMVIPA